MKRGLLVLPLLAAMAGGVASAEMKRPAAAPPTAMAPAPLKAKAEMPAAPHPGAIPTRIAQTVVARQAPVPMLMPSRPPVVVSATASSDAATVDSVDRKFSETEAKAAIEADGYKRPRIVSRAPDGTWQARALRGSIEVSLRVDAQGNVTGE